MTYCEFCGWETHDSDARVCPKCREYKGLVRDGTAGNEYDLDAKIAAYIASDPDWATREP